MTAGPPERRRRRVLAALLALAALAPARILADGEEDPERREPREWQRLDQVATGAMKASGTPGLSLAVVRDGRTVYARGYGVLRAGEDEPVTPESIFEAASLGKPVFAAAVIQLAVSGKFNLNRPLVEFVPAPFAQRIPSMMSSMAERDPRLLMITPRMLLTHSSGLPNWGRGRPLEFAFEPGSGFRYSGEGYVHLETLVEEVSGKGFHDVVRRDIFEPLGMADSSFTWEERFRERLAWGHDAQGRPEKRAEMKMPISAASLYSTAEDYARFLASMMTAGEKEPAAEERPGRRSKAGRPRRPMINDLMLPSVRAAESIYWSMGWGQEITGEGTYFWHWGDNEHYKNFAMGSLARREAVVIFTNGVHGLVACRAVVEHLFGREHPALEFPLLNY